MLSIDTNILLYAQNQDCPEHQHAVDFLQYCADRDDVAICELVLLELYQLLRNRAVLAQPLSSEEAVEICQGFRENPRWALIEGAPVMSQVWAFAAQPGIARRRVFDARIAYTLQYHGIRTLATRNVKDFEALGFDKLWDPIAEGVDI